MTQNRSLPRDRTTARKSSLPVARCGGCDQTWQSNAQAHCAACHRHFGSVDLFDRHRIGFACEDPLWLPKRRDDGTVRMILVDGVYREPGKEWA